MEGARDAVSAGMLAGSKENSQTIQINRRLPNRLHRRRSDLAIPANDGDAKINGGRGYNSVGHIRHRAPWNVAHRLNDLHIVRCFFNHILVIGERAFKLFIRRYRQSVLLGQINDFGKADG